MRIAIVGAGAVGAYLGAKLSASGEKVFLIARGPHLQAMQAKGVRVYSPLGDFEAHPTATDNYKEIGIVDYVFLTVKAHGLRDVVCKLEPLLGPDTSIVSAQNGIPWWYFQRHGGQWDGIHLESVDPGGKIATLIPPECVIGCIIYPSMSILEPGIIQHIEGNRFSIGELDGSTTDRCRGLADTLNKAGLRCPIRSRIRDELWAKLMGNLSFNPVSALTRATLSEIATHSETRAVIQASMQEVDSVAMELGVKIPVTIERRIEGAEKVGGHKTSMFQDIIAGKPIEIESLVGAVIDLGEKLGVNMPYTKTIYACTKLLAQGMSKNVNNATL